MSKFVRYIIVILVNALAVYLSAWLLSGVQIDGVLAAVFTAFILAIINTFLRPIIVILTLPISILTLGLFILFINAGLILFAAWIVPGFNLDSFWWAFWFGIVNAIIGAILGLIIKPSDDEQVSRKGE